VCTSGGLTQQQAPSTSSEDRRSLCDPKSLWHKIRDFRAAGSAIAAYFGLRLLAVTCLGDDFYAQAEARRGALKAKKLPLPGIFLLAVPTQFRAAMLRR